MKVVSPAITSVRRFVPRPENSKKSPKSHHPSAESTCATNIATREGDFPESPLEAEERLVLLPDQPGHGGEPEPDYGRVGREDPAVVLGGVAGRYHRDVLVMWESGALQPLLGGVVEDDGAHGLELAPPGSLPGVLQTLRETLRGLYEQGVARLLEAEVEVARAVARGDRYLGFRGPDSLQVLPYVRRAADLDVVPELRARRQLAAL